MSRHSRSLDILLVSVGLALTLLVFAAWDVQRAFSPDYSGRVVSSIVEQIRRSPVTMSRLYVFAGTVALLYVALGLLIWLSTLATIYVFPTLHRHRHVVTLVWFAALSLTIGFANADLYPSSRAGLWSRAINDFVAPALPLWKVAAPSIFCVWALLLARALHQLGAARLVLRVAAWGAVALAAALTMGWTQREQASELAFSGTSASRPPDVILIGIDSLRPSLVGDRSRLGYMPVLSEFTHSGHRFTDAITPLARTFPSWMALLSGRRPTTTGIRENLMPRALVNTEGLLPNLLGQRGYQTIYATDEVRFSNIDASYGFEETLTPRIGASDFLVGRANDLPLTNLLANTALGQWLFPDTYANRAADTIYDPKSFVDRIRRSVNPDGRPTFLAIHLTLPHWPYQWREERTAFSGAYDSAYSYLASVVEADRQFGEVMSVLKDKGLLNSALVVVFSDHGEGLNRASDNLVQPEPGEVRPQDLPPWVWGHGTSVLSAPQYEIFLAARTFGIPGYGGTGVHDDLASIEDIAPTVMDVLDVSQPFVAFDGVSLAANLRTQAGDGSNQQGEKNKERPRVRFTESAYSTPSLRQGAADEASLIEEGSDVFRVNPDTGWVEIRTELWHELMAVRERAAIGPRLVLAAIPTETPGKTSFYLVPRTGGPPLKLASPPDPTLGEEATELWAALFQEYGTEIGQPTPLASAKQDTQDNQMSAGQGVHTY